MASVMRDRGAGPGPGLPHDRPDGLGDGPADDRREGCRPCQSARRRCSARRRAALGRRAARAYSRSASGRSEWASGSEPALGAISSQRTSPGVPSRRASTKTTPTARLTHSAISGVSCCAWRRWRAGSALARLQPAQGLEHVPGDGVVLAERVAPRDDQDGVRTVDHAVTSLARRSEAAGRRTADTPSLARRGPPPLEPHDPPRARGRCPRAWRPPRWRRSGASPGASPGLAPARPPPRRRGSGWTRAGAGEAQHVVGSEAVDAADRPRAAAGVHEDHVRGAAPGVHELRGLASALARLGPGVAAQREPARDLAVRRRRHRARGCRCR